MDEPTRGEALGRDMGCLREPTHHEVVGDPFGADAAFGVGGTKQV
jgi:hypothetical protein